MKVTDYVCVRCNTPLDTDKTLCSSCLKEAREMARERRRRLIEKGLCVTCGKIDVSNSDHLECESCLAEKKLDSKRRYKRRKENNICTRCGKEKEDNEYIWCESCRGDKKDRYNERKAKGLCPDCGREREDPNYVKCESCRKRVREANRG